MRSEIRIVRFGNWLKAIAPVSGDPAALLRVQLSMPFPAKFAAGPTLCAEARWSAAPAEAERSARRAVQDAFAVLGGAAPPTPQPQPAAGTLEWLRTGGAAEWSLDGSAVTCRYGGCRIAAVFRGAIVLETDLADASRASQSSVEALAHFALALNTRLRVARASFAGSRLLIEAPTSSGADDAAAVREALDAIEAGAAAARRPCSALLNAEIARQYLDFQRREAAYDVDDSNCGLEPVASGRVSGGAVGCDG